MSSDPIVAEIRRIREQIAAEFNYDLHAMVKDAQQRDAAGDRLVVRREPRPTLKPVSISAKTA
jgi:hypothetical protein